MSEVIDKTKIIRVCKIHGPLTYDQTQSAGTKNPRICSNCRLTYRRKMRAQKAKMRDKTIDGSYKELKRDLRTLEKMIR